MDILDKFRETNALLEGHFILSSGLHSPKYLQCALALQRPEDALLFGRMILERLSAYDGNPVAIAPGSDLGIGLVASPAIGGLVIGFAVAQALGVRFLWTERQNGEMTLRRGFTLAPGERILVVEDVITTGGSTRECIAALEANGGKVIAAASIIDRSNGTADVGVPRISLVEMDVPSYSPDECPMCADGIEAVKPGSRSAGK
ncbi:MAG: orotate phosphoribosyltransferase [Acidobacteria bacterium]|nr:orotate phosphoribosyltransferase [Acidobacteriota bacterium]MBP7476362.1 orotate phosphoribosyltransferase [Pyrinomonadaceae bacterium]